MLQIWSSGNVSFSPIFCILMLLNSFHFDATNMLLVCVGKFFVIVEYGVCVCARASMGMCSL